ncbi:hypothetical protein HMI54_005846 [Coelomomyces lativittatus]|nr:hypothetical protein HMI54_005846 [Coelomomyces lativittatus]KAJ1506950.1 hypothetical protein HMI55_000965 [Coelomomyces lativittatus]
MDSKAALDIAGEKHMFKMDFLRKFLLRRRFKPELQQKIIAHENFLWAKGQGVNEDKLFDNLPISLRQEVYNHLYLEMLDKVPIFKDTDISFRHRLVRVMKSLTLPSAFFVCLFGETGEEMYFVRSGVVEVLSPKLDQVYVELTAGSFFGEVVLFDPSARRTATVRTKTPTELCVLCKDDFQAILKLFPEIEAVFLELVKQRQEESAKRRLNEKKIILATETLENEKIKDKEKSSLQNLRSSINNLHESAANTIKDLKLALSSSINVRNRKI